MGKHSSPQPGFAKQLISDLASATRRSRSTRPAGRHSGREASTATSVLATVKQRPVVAAIAVPAAATAAIVGSTVVMGPPEPATVSTEAASTVQQTSSNAGVSQDQIEKARDEAAKEYIADVKKDPRYKNTTKKVTLDVSVPSPTATGDSGKSGTKGTGDSTKSGGSTGSVPGGTSAPPCSVSSSIESGLLPNAVNGYRAVCARFPEVKVFGGRRPGTGSDHNTGEAVDIMISGSTGDRIADYLIKNHSALNVKYVIWKQRIWMPSTGSWKHMSDRGSATANHFDHVHASFN